MKLKEYAKKKIKPGRAAATVFGPIAAKPGRHSGTSSGAVAGAFLGAMIPAIGVAAKTLSEGKKRSFMESIALGKKFKSSWPLILSTLLGGMAGSYIGHGPDEPKKREDHV